MGMTATFLRVTEKELEEYKTNSEKLEDRFHRIEIYDDPNFIDIDKSWQGIIFLLTGQNLQNASGELLSVIFSENFVDPTQNFGFGPAHYLNSEEIKTINNKISNIKTKDLKNRFDPVKMDKLEVYPKIWDEGETAFEYLNTNFIKLKNFYQLAAQDNQAIISIVF